MHYTVECDVGISAAWVDMLWRVREMSGDFTVLGEWLPCVLLNGLICWDET